MGRKLYATLPLAGVSRPVFILGCGRSGKSTLAGLLSGHPEILYLNEPRHLWFSAFPESDIWTPKAASRGGRIALTEQDFTPFKSRQLSRLFGKQLRKVRRSIVVEELAINNFRLELINRVFPDAVYIHVYRNGLDVADLIEQAANRGGWFGANQYKWHQLVDFAAKREATARLPSLCNGYRDMGLLEWRLSTESVVSFLSRMPSNSYLEMHSSRIVRDPVAAASDVFDFIGAESAATLADISWRQSSALSRTHSHIASEKERRLGGVLLPISNADEGGLVPHWRN